MLDDGIGDTEDADRRGIAMRRLEFEDRRTKPANHGSVFDRNDPVEFLEYLMQKRFIQRLYKPHIVMRRVQPACPQFPDRHRHEIPGMTQTENGNAFPVLYLPALSDR